MVIPATHPVRILMMAFFCGAACIWAADDPKPGQIWTCHDSKANAFVFPDKPPQDCPAPPSGLFRGMRFTGRYANYTKADTWFPSWASDGNLYSPWTDGTISGKESVWSAKRSKADTGYARISGDDPLNLTVSEWGVTVASAEPYQGRYPAGSLVRDGVWYYGTYALDQPEKSVKEQFGWYVLGPLVGFRWSTDHGKTWHETDHTPDKPLFPEAPRGQLDLKEGKQGPFVKMGAPHFVDFGKNMEHSPDGKAYLVGHGAISADSQPRIANNSWVTGDAVYMARVTPGIATINDGSQYEFFAGRDARGKPLWSRKFEEISPVFSWNNHCGIATMTYNPVLRKYFLCVTDGHRGTTSRGNYTSYVLESDELTGPWSMVTYMRDFGPEAYFLNFPSKFISDDGRTMWLCYSANYMSKKRNDPAFLKTTSPPGSAYALSLHEVSLERR